MGQQIGAVDPTTNGQRMGVMDPKMTSCILGCFIPGSFNIGMFGLLRDVLIPLRSGDIE